MLVNGNYQVCSFGENRTRFKTRFYAFAYEEMGLMHNYVIQCMRVRLGGTAKQVPPFFRECVFHFYIRTGYKYTSLIRKLSGIHGGLNLIHQE